MDAAGIGWQVIEDWTEDDFGFLAPLMQDSSHGTPPADTFRRVFAMLSLQGFGACFAAWSAQLQQSTGGKLLAIDGKTLRRSFQHAWSKSPIHMVSAYASANGLVLGQAKVDVKENEIVAIPMLLELLQLKGMTATIDAMGCQKHIAQKIVEDKGDYLLAVKDNQPALHSAVKKLLDEAILEGFEGVRHDHFEQTDGDHGRIETRRVWVSDEVNWLKMAGDWPGLRQVAVVESRRESGKSSSMERRYYVASHRKLDAKRTAEAIRSHWRSRTRCTGCWTVSSTRTRAAFGRDMVRRTSRG